MSDVINTTLSTPTGTPEGTAPKQANLKKLNWKVQMLNHPSLSRAGGTIWKELPTVEVPQQTFSHLFQQRVHETLKKQQV